MKVNAIRIEKQGSPEVMTLKSVDVAEPGAGEVLVRHTFIGLNFMDVYLRGGQYPLAVPSGIGCEGSGVVEALGADVTGLAKGDRVAYGGSAPGSYANLRLMPVDRLVKLPDDISEEQAAAILMKGMTVEYMLQRCYPVNQGDFVLFHAAAGGVGLVAGQWGKSLGATMIGVAGGPEKCALAKAHGYAHVIDRKSEDIVARVKEITGGLGVQVVYDSVGRDSFEASLKSLAPRGYFVSFGTTTGAPPPVEAATLQKMGSLYFTRPTLATYVANRKDLLMSADAVFDMVRKGSVKVHVGQRYQLAEAVKAHSDLESGVTRGSSVMIP